MKHIEAAIFDIGNVLLFFDYMKAAGRLMEKNGLELLPAREKITAANQLLETGRISTSEFLAIVRPEFRDTGDETEFLQIWADIFEENTRMTSLARALSQKMPVFLISNIGPIHHDFIFRNFSVFSIFQDRLFSYEVQLMKPDRRIFELAVTRFGVNPHNTFYFDDLAENCDAASLAGFQAHHFEPHREDLPSAWNIPL